MTNSYCQPNESVFWFPVSPGTVELPAAPNETISTGVPTNGVVVPPGFDIDDPDLCELFNNILPSGVDPIYPSTVTTDTVIPPYFEIVYYDFRVRSYLTLTQYNYDLTPTTVVALRQKIILTIIDYPYKAFNSIKLLVSSVTQEVLDYRVAVPTIGLAASSFSNFSNDAVVLFHFDGEPFSQQYINYGVFSEATIGSSGDPIITNNVGKFGNSSLFVYGSPSYVSVTDSRLALTTTPPNVAFNGWVYFQPTGVNGREHCIMSLDPESNGSRNGIFAFISSGYNWAAVYSNGYTYGFINLPEDSQGTEFQGKWIFWSLQKSGANIWTFHFANYSVKQWANGSGWFGKSKYYFGGYPTSDYNSLLGALDEVAIFYGTTLYPMDEDLTEQDFPVDPYPPASSYRVVVPRLRLTVAVEYVSVLIVTNVVVPVRTFISKAYWAASALVTVVDYNGSSSSITLVTPDVRPDFILIKNLTNSAATYSPVFVDTNRGRLVYNASDANTSNLTSPIFLASFNQNGITLNPSFNVASQINTSYRLVAFGNANDKYTEKAIAANSNVTVSLSVNNEFGFSICSWQGTGISYESISIPHGLASAPEIIFAKPNNSFKTAYFGTLIGASKYMLDGSGSTYGVYNTTSFNSTHVTASSNAAANYFNPNATTVMYCFTSIAGRTKFGFYDGLSLGTKNINTGFPPSLVIIRRFTNTVSGEASVAYSAEVNKSWRPFLTATSSGETTFTTDISVNSTGFSLPSTSIYNTTGTKYLYMAFRDAI